MKFTLSDDDRRIVDLLLDGASVPSTPDGPALSQVFSNPHPDMFENRLESVERILGLLDQYAAPEPPQDLLTRTLNRINESQPLPPPPIQPGEQPPQPRPQA